MQPRDGTASPFRYSASDKSLTAADQSAAKGRTIRALDRVTVRIAVDTSRVHPQLKVDLLDDESGEALLDILEGGGARAESG